MPSLRPSVPTGAAPAMTLLRRLFGLADARDGLLQPAAPVTPSAIGPGIHFKGEIRGEGTLTITFTRPAVRSASEAQRKSNRPK